MSQVLSAVDDATLLSAFHKIAIDCENFELTDIEQSAINAIIKNEAKNSSFRAFTPDNDVIPIEECNRMATRIIYRLYAGQDGETGILDSREWYHYHAHEEATTTALEITDDHFDHGVFTIRQRKNLIQYLTDTLEEAYRDANTSTPRDMLSSHDCAEVVFVLMRPEKTHLLDTPIETNSPRSAYTALAVTDNLTHALSVFGYTLSDYRKASKSTQRARLKHGQIKLSDTRKVRSTPPLCPLSTIENIVNNACANHFVFCLYAIVPILDLIDLDITKSMTFSTAVIAAFNPQSETFCHSGKIANVTVRPEQGRIMSVADDNSPADICGLVHSYYKARISQ